MKTLLRGLLAIALTVPVFLGIAPINALLAWLYSESGYQALGPLFHLFCTVGVEGHESVITSLLLTLSFVLSALIVWLGAALLSRRR
ncbi:hypothetical protein [Paraburkholderia bryophila]|jgi:hypothetical protein|uniref:Uncharacterized protein n=1 Tax=Paraburkholderia bryophila TaxID=420952 RepID=A0A329BW59_9BURK|nr:hypothetical protein [Paraburkholderia bryophila]RAS25761.1 hypothetical protein BX591_1157 [Paraburkholderia bryophila]